QVDASTSLTGGQAKLVATPPSPAFIFANSCPDESKQYSAPLKPLCAATRLPSGAHDTQSRLSALKVLSSSPSLRLTSHRPSLSPPCVATAAFFPSGENAMALMG